MICFKMVILSASDLTHTILHKWTTLFQFLLGAPIPGKPLRKRCPAVR